MKFYYEIANISRQAHYKHYFSSFKQAFKEEAVLAWADIIRQDHSQMGCRKLYQMLQPSWIGRDSFEAILLNNGYRVKTIKNYKQTTKSAKEGYAPNLIKGIELTDVNQLWVTDMTYFRVKEKFHYLIFIMDVYSREILGYSINQTMQAEGFIKALKMAVKKGGQKKYPGLIHHSDRGSQYLSKDYNNLLKTYKITPSMGKSGLENGYAERLNGIIKYEYLYPKKIDDLNDLKKKTIKAVKLYNEERPHLNLIGMRSPLDFKDFVVTLPYQQRPTVKVYTDGEEFSTTGALAPRGANQQRASGSVCPIRSVN